MSDVSRSPKLKLVAGRDVHPLESARSGLLSSHKGDTNSGNAALRYAVEPIPEAEPSSNSDSESGGGDAKTGQPDLAKRPAGSDEANRTPVSPDTKMPLDSHADEVNPSAALASGKAKARTDEWSTLLVKIGRDRDEAAFARLFDHFAPLLKGFCQSHSSAPLNSEVSEELMQEVMIKVWQKADNYDPTKAAANTWIFTILRNTRIDYLRKNSKHSVTDNDLETDDIWDDELDHQPLSELQQERIKTHINLLLDKIPEEQAHCLRMVYMKGKSHADIAHDMDLPLGTVKSRVRLGLKRIESKLRHLDL